MLVNKNVDVPKMQHNTSKIFYDLAPLPFKNLLLGWFLKSLFWKPDLVVVHTFNLVGKLYLEKAEHFIACWAGNKLQNFLYGVRKGGKVGLNFFLPLSLMYGLKQSLVSRSPFNETAKKSNFKGEYIFNLIQKCSFFCCL